MPAEKGCDADDLWAKLLIRGVRPLVLWRSNRRDRGRLNRERHVPNDRTERVIGVLKRFRRLANRHDRISRSFLSFVQLAAMLRWTRDVHTTWRVVP